MRSSTRVGLALVFALVAVAAALLIRAALPPAEPALMEPASVLTPTPPGASPPPTPSVPSARSAPSGSALAPPGSALAPPGSALAPPGSALAPSAPAAAVPAVCRGVLLHNERVLDGHTEPDGASFSESCYPDTKGGSGAWALRLDAWEKTGDWAGVDTWAGSYTVIRVEAGGSEIAGKPAWSISGGMSYSTVSEPLRFDFDGDGRPELFLHQYDKEHEGASSYAAKLLTFRDGKVTEYPGLPAAYEAMEDADGDGRPDLIYHPYSSIRTHPGSQFDFTSEGPSLLLHSVPGGTFSTSDAAAQAFARKDCPTPRGAEADAGASADVEPELCARLWGASKAEALALLRSLCPRGAKCEGGCAETNDPCAYFKDRAQRLSASPPLRLGP